MRLDRRAGGERLMAGVMASVRIVMMKQHDPTARAGVLLALLLSPSCRRRQFMINIPF